MVPTADAATRGIPSTLKITFRALCKAVTYAKLVCKQFGDAEYIGFLLSDPAVDPDLVDDVLLAPGQTATRASVELSASAVLEAGREIRAAGKRARGWCHSHSRMATFHSCVDDSTTRKLLHELAPANVIRVAEEMPVQLRRTPAGVEVYSQSKLLWVLEDDLLAGADAEPKDSVIASTTQVAAVYSLVVNRRGETYSEIATKHWCPACRRPVVKAEHVELEVLDSGGRPSLDVAAMKADVRERVSANRWSNSGSWGHGGGGGGYKGPWASHYGYTETGACACGGYHAYSAGAERAGGIHDGPIHEAADHSQLGSDEAD